jgi:hypothetical protein
LSATAPELLIVVHRTGEQRRFLAIGFFDIEARKR